MLSPGLDSALVLGLGSGATAGTVAEIFNRVDVVEINSIIIQKQSLMKQYSFHIMEKPNVQVFLDDGIRFIKNVDKKYQMIINTVTTPLYFSSSKLYTADFFQDIKQHLTPDGIYTTWVDYRIGKRGLLILLKTLQSQFPYCWVSMMRSQYFLLHCSRQPLQLRQESAIRHNGKLKAYFWSEHHRRLSTFRYAIVNINPFGYLPLVGEIPVNTLDYPALEFEMANIRNGDLHGFQDYIFRNYSIDQMNRNVYQSDSLNVFGMVAYYQELSIRSPFTRYFRNLAEETVPNFPDRFRKYMGFFLRMNETGK